MKIAVLGAAGRMGQALTRVLVETPGCAVAGGIEAKGSPALGRDIGEVAGLEPLGVAITDDPHAVFAQVDGVLDFTSPASTIAFAALSAQARIVHVIGTTGLSAADEAKIEAAARHATIVKAGNMSQGVNLLAVLTAQVARALGPEFDIEILEMHHRHKRDAPSGTSLMLGRAAAEAREVSLQRARRQGPRRRCRPEARRRYRLCRAPRRRRGRRASRDLRRPRRAHRACAYRHRSRHFRPRRGEGGAVGARQATWPLLDAGRARAMRGYRRRAMLESGQIMRKCLKGGIPAPDLSPKRRSLMRPNLTFSRYASMWHAT